MDYLWTSHDMQSAMMSRPAGLMPEGVSGLSIDTRTLKPGEAYFAIKGDLHDGHDFVTRAEAAGAALAVVAEHKLSALGHTSLPLMVVSDVLAAMGRLAQAARARAKAQIIAVTGSVGKTTTKEALRHVLSESGSVHASAASFNNHWGVPLSLARMPQDCQFGVFEIGMNHPGEIRPLAKLVRPHLAIITNVAAAHLGAFDSVEEIALAKSEIFDGVVGGGAVLLNRDGEHFELLKKRALATGIRHVYGFGEHDQANVVINKLKLHNGCSCMTAKVFGEDAAVKIGMPGRHIAMNALAVLGAASLTGADPARSALALASLRPAKGRGERHVLDVNGGRIVVIDESYNANPASMEAALDLLGGCEPQNRGRRIAVLGDMLELGDASADLHAALAGPIEKSGADRLFLAGTEIEPLRSALPSTVQSSYAETAKALQPILLSDLRPDDVVMIKASKGLKFGGLVEALLKKFPRAA